MGVSENRIPPLKSDALSCFLPFQWRFGGMPHFIGQTQDRAPRGKILSQWSVAALWKIRLIIWRILETSSHLEKVAFLVSCRDMSWPKRTIFVASKGTWMVDHLDHGFEDVFNTLSILSFHHHFGILTSIFTHFHGFPSLFITFPSVWRFSKFWPHRKRNWDSPDLHPDWPRREVVGPTCSVRKPREMPIARHGDGDGFLISVDQYLSIYIV